MNRLAERIKNLKHVTRMRKAARTLRGATLHEYYTAKMVSRLVVPTEKLRIITSLDQIAQSLTILREHSRHPSRIADLLDSVEELREIVLSLR